MNAIRTVFTLLFLSVTILLNAQSYSTLWERMERAVASDLPREAIRWTTIISERAATKGDVTQEMMAQMVQMRLWGTISPDSLQPCRERIARRIQHISQPTDSIFWNAYWAKTQAESTDLNYDERRQHTHQLLFALSNMERFHALKAKALKPMVKQGTHAAEFGNDVLHIFIFDCLDKLPLSEDERTHLCQRAEAFYRSQQRYAAAIRLALRYEDAESVVHRYAEVPENAIAYATWVEQCYHQANLTDNKMRQHVVTLARKGLAKYGKHPDAKRIKALVAQLEQPKLDLVGTHALCYPNIPMQLAIQANNLHQATFELHRCTADGDTLLQRIETLKMQFPKTERWCLQYDTLALTLPHPGAYKLVLKHAGGETASSVFHCSRVAPYIFTPGNGACRIKALDAQTGMPIQDFSVVRVATKETPQRMWRVTKGEQWLRLKDVIETASNESATASHWADFQILLPGDSCSKPFCLNLSNRSYHGNEQRQQQRAQLFLDRTIFRPGQTVHLAGILYTQTDDSLRVDANVAVVVKLQKRGQTTDVATLQVQTDAYGRFSATFELPSDQQEGRFYFQVHHADTIGKKAEIPVKGGANFSVGAYKRQTFTVDFHPLTMAYTWGDTLQVSGKVATMTLQPMDNALIRYTITEPTPFRGVPNKPIEGVVHTDAQGVFTFPLVLKQRDAKTALWRRYNQSYRVSISVRGDNGETQNQQLYIPLYENATTLDVTVPEVVVKEHLPQLLFHHTNNLAVKIDEPVTVCLYNERDSLVWIQKCPANAPFSPADWSRLNDGTYTLEAQTPSGGRVTSEFLLIGEKSEGLPAKSPACFISQEIAITSSEKVVIIGNAQSQISLFKDVVNHKGEVLSSECLTLAEGVHRLALSYDTIYGEGATVCLTTLVEGTFYQRIIQLKRPQPDLRLKMSWQTFRNRLQPGQAETWKLRITHPDGTPARVALIARLYDASLDALAHNRWYATPYKAPYFVRPYGQAFFGNRVALYYAKKWSGQQVDAVAFSSWNPLLEGGAFHEFKVAAPTMQKSLRLKGLSSNTLREVELVTEDVAFAQETNGTAPSITLPLREHFDEVAFMDASLQTDADGMVKMDFTLPEQLTTWNFTGFAHDRNMRHVLIDTMVVAQKSVTVSVNAPRFMREGDQLTLPIVVRSLRSDMVKGRYVATCFDAETNTVFSQTTDSFTVDNGSVSFQIHLPALSAERMTEKGLAMPQAIGCQVSIEGADFADGEVHRIPILSDRVEVVRNLPFSFSDGAVHTYDLDTLWTDTLALRDPQLTISVTPSALYAATQALASLSVAPVYSIDDWARRYYALSIALYLHESGMELPEFDTEKAVLLREEAATVLRQKQLKNGAWSWFDGMHENAFITNEILLLLARLEALVGKHTLQETANQSLRYMHEKMERMRQEMEAEEQKTGRKLSLGELPLRYLDACAYLKVDTTAACSYFLSKAANMNARYSLYGKAVMSRVLRQHGEKAAADLLLRSVQEYLVESPEMGAYFDAPKATMTYNSYRIPTQTAVIEAFHAVGNTDLVKRMQQWLLQSRRTQQWETSRATADAVFALCLCEGDTARIQFARDSNLTPMTATRNGIYRTLRVATCDTAKVVSVASCQDTIAVCVPHATMSSKRPQLLYGSARASYSLPLSKVEQFDSGLKISLRLEVKRNGVWQELAVNEPMDPTLPLRQVAIIVASRDFDFVRLSFPRPACAEPVVPLSGYSWQQHVGCYRVVTDNAADFYVDKLPKGTYTIVEALHTDRTGTYEQGIATITCTYAPEFAGNSVGRKVYIK